MTITPITLAYICINFERITQKKKKSRNQESSAFCKKKKDKKLGRDKLAWDNESSKKTMTEKKGKKRKRKTRAATQV